MLTDFSNGANKTMQITGIIAEYNPFHNGHAYQIDQCRKMGADYIIVVMSGNYVQRGEPAILDKYSRVRIMCKVILLLKDLINWKCQFLDFIRIFASKA